MRTIYFVFFITTFIMGYTIEQKLLVAIIEGLLWPLAIFKWYYFNQMTENETYIFSIASSIFAFVAWLFVSIGSVAKRAVINKEVDRS